ncbi:MULTISPECIES: aromatic acid exporter family protein [Streptomyces]|uniref:FUSC family protein n=1 Tax=Streptomyces TaxID=1883 RepID=UPI001F2FF5B5|nr:MULTISPECIES: FUSC family protein [Streptomyces]MCF3165985.1 FUSC family protein [Streptomyces violaceoruber]MDW4898400.1 FUSC family protein [Streptomyces californicus]
MYEAWSRVKGNLWPVLQQSAAAALSWWIAGTVFDHHVPLFAPIATLVALNTPVGGRGTNAVRVMSGVIAGVVVGQAAFRLLGHGDGAVGAAVLCALLVALLIDGERITMAQAAVGAVISVAAGQQAGIDRVLDALLGAGVALVFSQVLFPPHPFTLLRRAEADTLKGLGRALELTARTLDASADEREDQPWRELRPVYTLLDDLGHTRDDAIAVARRTPRWRGRREPIRREIAATRHLDLLGNSCLTLIRGATILDPVHRKAFAATVRGLSGVLDALGEARGSHVVFQHAARRTLDIVRDAPERGSAVPVAVGESVRLVAADILVFAGADADEAERTVRDGSTDITVERRAHPEE